MKQAVERKDALYLKEHSNKLFGKSLNLPAPQEIISLRNALENEAYTLELFEALIQGAGRFRNPPGDYGALS